MIRPLAVPRPIHSFPAIFAVLLIGIAGIVDPGISQETPATASKPAEASADNPESKPAKPAQYTKNVSPSGLAIGVLNSKIDGGGLPEAVEKLAKEGAMASAENPPNWEKAREAYLKMVQAAPRNALAFANLGIVEYRLGNYEAARAALNRSLNLNPSIAHNWLTLGLTYHKEGNYELAISSLARALHQDPENPRIHLYMAIVIRDYGWGSAAETELLRAIQLDHTYADAHFNLALMYLEKEPPAIELARRHYYVAVDLGAERDEQIEKQLQFVKDREAAKKAEAAKKDSEKEPVKP